MRNAIPVQTLTIILASVIAASRFVSVALAQAAAGDNTYGVSRTSGLTGEPIAIDVLGTTIVETGGALLAGALIESDVTGRAVTHSTGKSVARLAPGESASAAGQFVEIILLPN